MNIFNRFSYRMAATIVAVLGASVGLGCMTTTRSMPTAHQLVESGLVEADADADALYRGRALAMTSCVECHRQYFPQEFHPGRWPILVQDMGERSNLRPDQIRALRAYMVAASKTEGVPADEESAESEEVEPLE